MSGGGKERRGWMAIASVVRGKIPTSVFVACHRSHTGEQKPKGYFYLTITWLHLLPSDFIYDIYLRMLPLIHIPGRLLLTQLVVQAWLPTVCDKS